MFKILPLCECTCDVHERQGFNPELLIMSGRLPLMDAGSDPAFEAMAQSQQGPESSGGNQSCWFSPVGCAFSSGVVCSRSPFLSLPFS